MAQKFTLVPQSWITAKSGADSTEAPSNGNLVVEEAPKSTTDDKVDELLKFFSKRVQSRANTLLRFIIPKINLDENLRIVYGDGTVGSNIIDLVRYVILPKLSSKTRKADSERFALLLRQVGAPNSVIARDLVLNRSTRSDNSNHEQSAQSSKHGSKPRKHGSQQRKPTAATANGRTWKWQTLRKVRKK